MHDKSLGAFLRGVQLLAACMPAGLESQYAFGALHEEIVFSVDRHQLPEASTEAHILDSLGFHYSTEHDSWAYFT